MFRDGPSGCYPANKATPGTVKDAVVCAKHLTSLGTRDCRARKNGTVLCTSGTTVVKGYAFNKATTSSWCKDVAAAVVWVLDHCPACGQDHCAIAGAYFLLYLLQFPIYR